MFLFGPFLWSVEVLAFGPCRGPCCGHCVAVLVVFDCSGPSCGPGSGLLVVVLVVLALVLASSPLLWSLVVVLLWSGLAVVPCCDA